VYCIFKVMQTQVLSVESLQNKKDIHFPEYESDERLSTWNCAVEKVSLPADNIKNKLGKKYFDLQHLDIIRGQKHWEYTKRKLVCL